MNVWRSGSQISTLTFQKGTSSYGYMFMAGFFPAYKKVPYLKREEKYAHSPLNPAEGSNELSIARISISHMPHHFFTLSIF